MKYPIKHLKISVKTLARLILLILVLNDFSINAQNVGIN